MKLKVALFGFGHLGKWHAGKLNGNNEIEFVGIVDPSEKSRTLAKESFPSVNTFSNVEEVINMIDAGVVVTPTSFHFDVAKKLLENKKHVFCEKPLTSTLEQALELKEILADQKLVVQVGHSERCHQAWEMMDKFQDAVKDAQTMTLKRTSPFKGRASDVGVVEDLMIHDIDLVRMFYGDPISVFATGAKLLTKNFDHVIAVLKYKERLVTIEASRVDVEVSRCVQFVSNKANLKVDLLTNKLLYSHNLTTEKDQEVEAINYEKRDHLLLEQQKFFDSILRGKPIFVNIDDGIDAIRVIKGINDSLANGKEVFLGE